MSVAANIVEVAALVGDTARATMLAALMEGRSLDRRRAGRDRGRFEIDRQWSPDETRWGAAPGREPPGPALLLPDRVAARGTDAREHRGRGGLRGPGSFPAPLGARRPYEPRSNLLRPFGGPPRGRHRRRPGPARVYCSRRRRRRRLALGARLFADFGLDLESLGGPQWRIFCRPCLDATERRAHLAGRLGKAIACRCFALGWLVQAPGTRVVEITRAGSLGLKARFAFDPHEPRLPAVTAISLESHTRPVSPRA